MSAEEKLSHLLNLTNVISQTFRNAQFVLPVIGQSEIGLNFSYVTDLWRHWLPEEALSTLRDCEYILPAVYNIHIYTYTGYFRVFNTSCKQQHTTNAQQRPHKGLAYLVIRIHARVYATARLLVH